VALYAVEHELSRVSVERYCQVRDRLIAECAALRGQGRRVRFISSVLDPSAARAVSLFGSEGRELVEQVNKSGDLPAARIFEVLDLTPGYVRRDMSRGRRRPDRGEAGGDPSASVADRRAEIRQWMTTGTRLVEGCVEAMRRKEQLEGRVETLEQDNERLRAEVDRLQQDTQILIAEREELIASFHALADRVREALGSILRRHPGAH
jgi:hypothetical protein